MNKNNYVICLGLYVSLFANYWRGFLTIFYNNGQLLDVIVFSIALYVIGIVKFLIDNKFRIRVDDIIILFICAIIVGLYSITQLKYSKKNSLYNTYLLVLVTETCVSILECKMISHYARYKENFISLSPPISWIFFFTSLYNTINSTGVMGANLVDNDNGMNYQVISYCCAVSSILLMHYIITFDKYNWINVFNTSIMRRISKLLIIANGFLIFRSGGRGGFVLFLAGKYTPCI